LSDGLIVRQSNLHTAIVDGSHDHRVVMSLAVAGTMIDGESTITTAESAAVTVPGFSRLMTDLGANLREQ